MVSSAEIIDLKRIVAKNPKSLAFVWLADLLREASSGDKQKLDEALLTVNKGLAIYSNFLPGRLTRGRILLEKGDLAGAKNDFEAVAEQDSFCSSALKLLLETSEKLGQPSKTDIYQKLLGTLEPGVVVKVESKTEQPKAETGAVNAALDDLLDEEDNADTEDKEESTVSDLLLQTFDNIFESSKEKPTPVAPIAPIATAAPAMPDLVPYTPPARKSPPPAPNVDSLVKEQLSSKVENVPDLTGDMNSLLESADALPPVSSAPSLPDMDTIINEQLKSKVENAPDLTSDMDSLLASASTFDEPPPAKALNASPPNLDDLINEQLKSKVEDVPDLTGDLDSLLASAPTEPPPSPSPPDVDALIKEQLASKVENVPDLTGDLDSLLASVPEEPPPVSAAPSPPNIDDLVKEQLASKVENVPDLTGDLDSLLASAPEEPPPISAAPSPPNIDDLVKEQLASKVENAPDLTGDLDSLLASAPDFGQPTLEPSLAASYSPPPAPVPSSPDLDALVKEQLSSKVENIPDFTGDLDSLLASAQTEPMLEPSLAASYSMLTSSAAGTPKSSPNIDDLVKEQLSSKVENVPDLTGDLDSLLAAHAANSDEEPDLVPYVPPASKSDSLLTQNPTLTLAELYMDQGLPQKAVGVLKELLVQDPNNEDLKAKLALAETKV
jgi:Tfp pilus assembly protein PilF